MTHDPRTNQQSFIALFSYARLVLVVFLSHEHSHNKKMKKTPNRCNESSTISYDLWQSWTSRYIILYIYAICYIGSMYIYILKNQHLQLMNLPPITMFYGGYNYTYYILLWFIPPITTVYCYNPPIGCWWWTPRTHQLRASRLIRRYLATEAIAGPQEYWLVVHNG